MVEIKDHILHINGKPVKYYATPNRGKEITPKYLIMHFTGDNSPKATIDWFVNHKYASAHILVDREGNVYQFAPFNIRTWHAGESVWKGLRDINSHSIGIELTNLGGTQEYTPKQLEIATEISRVIVKQYNLEDILGHSDIAPGRKVDPGPKFPMAKFKDDVGIGKVCEYVKATSNLNLRAGAGTTHKIISVLPKDTSVEVMSAQGAWSKVHVINSKLEGWVSSSYLTK